MDDELIERILTSKSREKFKIIHDLNDMMLLSLSKSIRKKFKTKQSVQLSHTSAILIPRLIRKMSRCRKEDLANYYRQLELIVFESRVKLNELNPQNLLFFISELANHIKGELRDNEKAWKLLKLCASRGLMDQNIADKLSSTILDLLENNSSDTANLLYLLSKMIPILPLETFPAILGTLLKIFKQLNLNIENIRKYGMVTCVLLEDLVLLLRSNIVRTIIEKPENAEIFSRLISLYSKAIIAIHNQPGSESTVIHGGIDNGTTSILSPELLQIFSMLKYTCQIQSIIKLAKPLDLKKILFIFKFLFASIDDLEEFEPEENMSEVEADQESQYDKEKLAEICRPSLLTSVVEYTLQIFKLGSCVLNIKDFAVWIKVIQLIQEPEYNARYSEVSKLDKLKASILKLLAYVWTDFLKGDENELLCINKALIPCLVSPCGKIIENYFSQKASISEFNSALVLVSKFMLFKLYKNTAIDNGILEYLAHSSHIDQSLKKENLAYVKFLEEISHDSSIRFKLTTSSQDRNILHFMAGLATEAMKTLYHKGQEHLQDLLGDILAFLNQYFGHDPIICDLFCSEDDSILGQLINLLSNVIVDMLSLDLQDTTTSLSSQNIRHVSHFIDSLLRFEKPQVYILSQGLITSLAKIMLNINHSDVPEIFSKIIGRILTDPNLTLRVVRYMTIPLYFESIYPNTANEVQNILDSQLNLYQPIMLSLLEYHKSEIDVEMEWKCVLSLGYVSSKQMVKTILSSLPVTEGGMAKSQVFYIMTLILHIIQKHEGYYENGLFLFQYLSKQIPPIIHSLGTNYFFTKERAPCPQSSLIQHILYAHESISVQIVDADNIVTFLLPDDPNYHTVRCKCDKQAFCEQSIVFDQMLRGSFREGQTQVITIPHVTRRCWFLLMDWINLYKVWTDVIPFKNARSADVELIFQLMKVADRYILLELYKVCIDWLTDTLYYAAHNNIPDICKLIFKLISTEGEFMKNLEYQQLSDVCVRAIFATQSYKK